MLHLIWSILEWHDCVCDWTCDHLLVLQFDAHHSEGVIGSVVVDVDAAESLLSRFDGHPLLTGVIIDHDGGPCLADTLLAASQTEGQKKKVMCSLWFKRAIHSNHYMVFYEFHHSDSWSSARFVFSLVYRISARKQNSVQTYIGCKDTLCNIWGISKGLIMLSLGEVTLHHIWSVASVECWVTMSHRFLLHPCRRSAVGSLYLYPYLGPLSFTP